MKRLFFAFSVFVIAGVAFIGARQAPTGTVTESTELPRDLQFEGNTLVTFTNSGHLHLLTNIDQKHTLKIKTANNLNDTGISWENSGGAFTHTIFRTDVGSNRADLVFAAGQNANIDLLTNSFKIHGEAADEGKLEILGALQISSGVPGVGKVLTSDALGLATWTVPPGGGWTDDGTTVRLVTSSDSVGIGTGTPNAKLDVRGFGGVSVGGFPSGALHVTSTGAGEFNNSVITGHNLFGGNKQLWYLGSTSSGSDNIAFINRQNAELHFSTNSASRIIIQADGDVGIGDTSPDAQLEVLSTTSPQFRITHTDNVDHLDISVTSAGSGILQASGGQINLGNATGEVTVIFDVLKILPRSAAPSGALGMIYVDSDLNLPCFYNGTNWVQMDDFLTVCS